MSPIRWPRRRRMGFNTFPTKQVAACASRDKRRRRTIALDHLNEPFHQWRRDIKRAEKGLYRHQVPGFPHLLGSRRWRRPPDHHCWHQRRGDRSRRWVSMPTRCSASDRFVELANLRSQPRVRCTNHVHGRRDFYEFTGTVAILAVSELWSNVRSERRRQPRAVKLIRRSVRLKVRQLAVARVTRNVKTCTIRASPTTPMVSRPGDERARCSSFRAWRPGRSPIEVAWRNNGYR